MNRLSPPDKNWTICGPKCRLSDFKSWTDFQLRTGRLQLLRRKNWTLEKSQSRQWVSPYSIRGIFWARDRTLLGKDA